MNVLLIQIDGPLPNLALLKLSRFYKDQGEEVYYGSCPDTPDIVCVSCVFDWNKSKALGIRKMFSPKTKIFFGGSGIDLEQRLPDGVECLKPDYDLLNMDYSLGFTSRGCIRKCPFCIVPIKEGGIKDHTPIAWFHDLRHEKVILLDNNILAAPSCNKTFDYIIAHDLKVSINQGLDIRLMNKEFAEKLSKMEYYNWHFTARQIYFAWDQMGNEYSIRKGLETFLDAGHNPKDIMFYILTNYNTSFDEDMYRFNVLWDEYKVYSYIMIYNRMIADQKHQRFGRWVNRRVHKSCSFETYLKSFSDNIKKLNNSQTTLGAYHA